MAGHGQSRRGMTGLGDGSLIRKHGKLLNCF